MGVGVEVEGCCEGGSILVQLLSVVVSLLG